MVLDVVELVVLGYVNGGDMYCDIIECDSNDDSQWEMIMCILMCFNWLVLLWFWFWYIVGLVFGDWLENGWLVYLMFFEQVC